MDTSLSWLHIDMPDGKQCSPKKCLYTLLLKTSRLYFWKDKWKDILDLFFPIRNVEEMCPALGHKKVLRRL